MGRNLKIYCYAQKSRFGGSVSWFFKDFCLKNGFSGTKKDIYLYTNNKILDSMQFGGEKL